MHDGIGLGGMQENGGNEVVIKTVEIQFDLNVVKVLQVPYAGFCQNKHQPIRNFCSHAFQEKPAWLSMTTVFVKKCSITWKCVQNAK